ncbi:MAG: hypothetical protein Q4E22_06305 [Coriobacteriia bacterium]|nr:hypothetical protein [Coriobacteriia bacterium]
MYLTGIAIFAMLLFFVPFITIAPYGANATSFTFNELVNGRSPLLMSGAKLGFVAAFPMVSLLIALFLPNNRVTSWSKRAVSLAIFVMLVSFLASIFLPTMQAFAIITGIDVAKTSLYEVYPTWGSYLVVYTGIGLSLFMLITIFPKVREHLGLQEGELQ